MSNFSAIADNFISRCVQEVQRPPNKEKINNLVLHPIIDEINQKLYPYLLLSLVLYAIILLLLIGIFMMLMSRGPISNYIQPDGCNLSLISPTLVATT